MKNHTSEPTLSTTETQVLLRQLYQENHIDDNGYRLAQSQLLPTLQWRQWIIRLSLGLGTTLLLLGVIFFFAYNWHVMPKWSKLALIEIAMLVCFIAAAGVGWQKLLGQCLLLAATVFIGVFFAVFGQIYQTGADAWQLFALWAVLMFGFLWLSHFSAQWILQWSITGLALCLFMQQTLTWEDDSPWFISLIMAVYAFSIWCLQCLLARRYQWLNTLWLRVFTVFVTHVFLISAAIFALFDDNLAPLLLSVAATGAWLWWYRRQQWDLLAQVFCVMTLGVLTWALVIYVLFKGKIDLIAAALIILVVSLALSVLAYKVVIYLRKHNE